MLIMIIRPNSVITVLNKWTVDFYAFTRIYLKVQNCTELHVLRRNMKTFEVQCLLQ